MGNALVLKLADTWSTASHGAIFMRDCNLHKPGSDQSAPPFQSHLDDVQYGWILHSVSIKRYYRTNMKYIIIHVLIDTYVHSEDTPCVYIYTTWRVKIKD